MIFTEEELEDLDFFEEDIESPELTIYQPTLFDYLREDTQELNPNIVLWDDARWNECLKTFRACKKFGWDLETYGSESWHPLWYKKNKIRLIQVGLANGLCLIADLGGWREIAEEGYREKMLSRYAEFLDILKEKLFDPEVIVIGVNLKFDAVTIRHHFGFILRQARDLMIMSQVYWAGVGVEKAKAGENRAERCKMSHGLKGIAERFGYEVDKTEQSSNWGWNISNSQLNYAADDVIISLKIFDDFKPLILEAGLAYTAFIECNAVSVFAEIEFCGLPINLELAREELGKYEEKIQYFVDIFLQYFPTVQWSSNVQVLEAFSSSIDGFHDIFKDGETPNVSAEILHQIKHPAAKALLEARRLTTSANNLRGYINNSFDGHIRGLYRQIAPGGSGRTTCSAKMSVNRRQYNIGAQLQNPPNVMREYKGELKGVREMIQAPPGYKLIIADAAQAHMRIAAQVSQDPLLLKIFNDKFDGHSILAGKLAQLSGLPWSAHFISGTLGNGPRDEEWTKEAVKNFELRKNFSSEEFEDIDTCKTSWLKWVAGEAKAFRNVGKVMLYSSLNGSTKGRIFQELLSTGYTWATIDTAAELVSFFNSSYPNLVKYIKKQYEEANKTSYTFSHFKTFDGKPIDGEWGMLTTLTGRRLFLKKYPNRFKPGEFQVSYTDATASNWLPVEANLIKAWMVEVYNEFCDHPEWGAYIGNMPHDEGDFVCKEEYAEVVAVMIYEKMKFVFNKHLTLLSGVEEDLDPLSMICNNWSEK